MAAAPNVGKCGFGREILWLFVVFWQFFLELAHA
jgi:hypothetical protein